MRMRSRIDGSSVSTAFCRAWEHKGPENDRLHNIYLSPSDLDVRCRLLAFSGLDRRPLLSGWNSHSVLG
jgi:hypothetical protein